MADLGLIPVENRVVEHPNRYKLELVNAEENIYDLVAMPGAVAAEGTMVDKALLENIQRMLMQYTNERTPKNAGRQAFATAQLIMTGNFANPFI